MTFTPHALRATLASSVFILAASGIVVPVTLDPVTHWPTPSVAEAKGGGGGQGGGHGGGHGNGNGHGGAEAHGGGKGHGGDKGNSQGHGHDKADKPGHGNAFGHNQDKADDKATAKADKAEAKTEKADLKNSLGLHPSALGKLNAAHASPTALQNASPNSTVGMLGAYKEAVLMDITLDEARDALAEISNKPVDKDVVEAVNELLGVEISEDETSETSGGN